jgi:glucose/arabinose dehydrogenase
MNGERQLQASCEQRRFRRFARMLAAAASLACVAATSEAQSLLPGFSSNPVATVAGPTAMAFTPDGRLLITTQGGALRVHVNGALLPTPAFQFAAANICADNERGLLGVAVDPTFGFNGYIYLYYTFETPGGACVNRVSRFTLPAGNVISAVSELVLLDNIPSPAGNHNGGDLSFGFDGLLYVSVGDGGCSVTGPGCAENNDNARFLTQVLGKILRIRADGSIPASNPYVASLNSKRCADPVGPGAGSGPCQEIYAHGLRNPFRIAFRRGTDYFYINDVGQGTWEEIDRGVSGVDYGWNLREGKCVTGSTTNCPPPPAGLTDPVYAYSHASGCNSITGGAFVPPRQWTSALRDQYVFADFICGQMFALATNLASSTFGSGFGGGSLTALVIGPSATGRSLYYATYAGGGQVRRIDYTGAPSFAKQDFDGNVRSDLAWWRADGTIAIWMMNGGTIASSAGYSGLVPAWSFVGVGDFNGDGRGDLLFRNSSDGQLLAWLMNGGAITGTQAYSPGPTFTFAGVADVNGDGFDDIVLRGPAGEVSFWIVQSSFGPFWNATFPLATAWSYAGKGDVNGDGTDDIVWRRADGTTVIWFMNGKEIAQSASYAVGTEWTLRGTGDLNADGKADLLWRRTDGTVVFWLMNGPEILGSVGYPQTTAWNISGTADFNGDGRADIVWRNTDGSVAIWLMNGGAIAGSGSYTLGTEWAAVGLQ